MAVIRLTKEFSFEMAHTLDGYDGPCREIHGHSLVMRRTESNAGLVEALRSRYSKLEVTDYQPTCENMVADFAARIAARLPEGVTLHSVRLHETATSFAEWFAGDNP